MSETPKWIEKAKETFKFHREKILSHDNWTIAQTAKSLKRSIGSICEDLLLARWLKTHVKQMERFDYTYEALEFIRQKKKEQELEDLE